MVKVSPREFNNSFDMSAMRCKGIKYMEDSESYATLLEYDNEDGEVIKVFVCPPPRAVGSSTARALTVHIIKPPPQDAVEDNPLEEALRGSRRRR